MKNWQRLEPDIVKILDRHYTPGRGGKTIDKIVLHHNAGVLTTSQVWQVWQTRQASAHYQVETTGTIGQLVWDRDTAWHAANQHVNQTSIGIEHANSAGAAHDWPMTHATLEEGAHLVAAVCRYYHLGRPTYGVNVFSHRDFYQTSCPYHLAPGGRYHESYMARAVWWYEQMSTQSPTSQGVLMSLTDAEQRELLDKVRDIFTQLRGPGGQGWPQLGKNDRGQDLTVVDAVAAVRRDIAAKR